MIHQNQIDDDDDVDDKIAQWQINNDVIKCYK